MPDTPIGAVLTDQTGISRLTGSKVLKDFVADVLLTTVAGLAVVNIVDVGTAAAQPTVAAFAVIGAVIRAGYRAVLKWATS